MKTQSFTFRIPIDLLDAIKSNMGDCTRSEFIIQTLREALGVESQQISASPQISDLLYQFEILRSQFATISNRVSKLEEPQQISTPEETKSKTESKTIIKEATESYTLPTTAIEDKTESKTESKTKEEKSKEAPSTLDLNIPEVPEGAVEMNSEKLLAVLRMENPQGKWKGDKLRNKRGSKGALRWHQEGKYRFIYKGKGITDGGITVHNWWVIITHPDPEIEF
jgi:hypothetical protein